VQVHHLKLGRGEGNCIVFEGATVTGLPNTESSQSLGILFAAGRRSGKGRMGPLDQTRNAHHKKHPKNQKNAPSKRDAGPLVAGRENVDNFRIKRSPGCGTPKNNHG